jgi:hypothetical protein
MSEEEADAEGRRLFRLLYTHSAFYGTMELHGGGTACFFMDRWEKHASRTSSNRAKYPYAKDKIAIDRIVRVRWIKEILAGSVPGTECWHVRPQTGRNHPLDRLYVHWEYGYVVWLHPKMNGEGWRFSSAFPAPKNEIARFIKGGTFQWRIPKEQQPENENAP